MPFGVVIHRQLYWSGAAYRRRRVWRTLDHSITRLYALHGRRIHTPTSQFSRHAAAAVARIKRLCILRARSHEVFASRILIDMDIG
jgi:hypothetical protein